ncbi:MAG: SRPBCC family protein [Ignavibacteria bacterium]|nr:SRPBCC family protein [Ignavibacteria bacterium]
MDLAKNEITVNTTINAEIKKVWKLWNEPEHIVKWNYASDDWHTPSATNDLRSGGRITARMEAKDGSEGFDFEGIYDEILPYKLIKYTLGDSRKVAVKFNYSENRTIITETFDAEDQNPLELQKNGWQAILNNFKKYAESI